MSNEIIKFMPSVVNIIVTLIVAITGGEQRVAFAAMDDSVAPLHTNLFVNALAIDREFGFGKPQLSLYGSIPDANLESYSIAFSTPNSDVEIFAFSEQLECAQYGPIASVCKSTKTNLTYSIGVSLNSDDCADLQITAHIHQRNIAGYESGEFLHVEKLAIPQSICEGVQAK